MSVVIITYLLSIIVYNHKDKVSSDTFGNINQYGINKQKRSLKGMLATTKSKKKVELLQRKTQIANLGKSTDRHCSNHVLFPWEMSTINASNHKNEQEAQILLFK